jgi:hypothetical protein
MRMSREIVKFPVHVPERTMMRPPEVTAAIAD